MLIPILKSARPHQWVKNLFVAAPLVFARRIGDTPSMIHEAIGVAAFCLLSSAVYLINDLVDIEKDRAHAVKRHRPIASGAVPPALGRVLAALMAGGGVGLSVILGPAFVAVIV